MSEQATMDPPATKGEDETTPPAPAQESNAPVLEATKGIYMVIWAPVREDDEGPAYQEVGFYRAHNDEQAKRKAIAEHRYLKSAAEAGGIWLRAIPARSWEASIQPTRFERPAPKLRIG